MRLQFPTTVPFALLLLPLLLAAATAQEPDQEPTRDDAGKASEPAAPATPAAATIAIRAGHVHPIAGSDLEDGVVLVQGERIVAVGAADDVAIPADAEVVLYPNAHVYPGLVDALTSAFLDDAARGDGSLDAAAALTDALLLRHDREDELVRAGITTAYVRAAAGTAWCGIGTIVRPNATGFTVFPGKERAAAALKLASGPEHTHALERQKAIDGAFGAFEGLEDYRKKFADHEEALAKYDKEFAEYLAWFESKKARTAGTPAVSGRQGGGDGGGPASGPGGGGDAGETPQRGRGRGRRGGGGGGGGDRPTPSPSPPAPAPERPQPGKPPTGEAKQDPKPAAGEKPAGSGDRASADKPGADKAAADKPPERPKYPKAPDRDPQKDALLEILDGAMPLRAEVNRPDEIRRTIAAARTRKVPVLVLENVLGGAALAGELARAAVPCVLTGLWPEPLPRPYQAFDPQALPAALQAAGVAFAIASGSGRRAAALPLLAARAVGGGLDPAAALRAVTLTPAEILGVQADVGSLQRGKFADLLVCDRPLLQSDSRVLAVWSAGTLQYRAGPATEEPR